MTTPTETGEPAGSSPVASVIVLAYNAADKVPRSLSSLAAQDLQEPFEVIVVWSGEDGTVDVVRRDFPWARLAGRPERLLTGAARNLGLDHANGEIIAFLAADCEVPADWLRRRIQAHRAGFRCVGGAVAHGEPAGLVARASHLLEYIACSQMRPREVVVGHPLYNLSFDRTIYDEYGRYQEALACGEDTEFNWRVANGQEQALFDPEIRMIHREPERLRDMLRHQHWHGAWFGWLDRQYGAPARGGTKKLGLWWILLWYPTGRLARLVWRVVLWRPRKLPEVIVLTPLLAAGIVSATVGLFRGWRGIDPEVARNARRDSQKS